MTGSRRTAVDGGRVKRHEVKVSPEEEATIALAAQEQGVTWVRFMVEAGLAVAQAGDGVAVETPTARRQRMVELFALQAQVGELAFQAKRTGVNVNQLARGMHVGTPVPVEEMRGYLLAQQQHLLQARKLYVLISGVIDDLSAQGVGA